MSVSIEKLIGQENVTCTVLESMSLMVYIQMAKNNLRMEKQENAKEMDKVEKGLKCNN